MNAILTISGTERPTLRQTLAAYRFPVHSDKTVSRHKFETFWKSRINHVVGTLVLVGLFCLVAYCTAFAIGLHQNPGPIFSIVSGFCLTFIAVGVLATGLFKRWRSVSASEWFEKWNYGVIYGVLAPMPDHLRNRINILKRLHPDLKIRVEAFGLDPLIYVREPRLFAPRIYIGAWATGKPELDEA